MDSLDRAIDQMLGAGLQFKDGVPLVDGKVHRCGYGKSKDRGWYVLHEMKLDDGRLFITGAFGIWGMLEPVTIENDWKGIDPGEAAKIQQQIKDTRAREHAKRVQRARDAASRARIQWDGGRSKLKPDEVCEYLQRKGVEPDPSGGMRFLKDPQTGALIVAVPMIRYDVTEEQEKDLTYKGPRRLVGLQKIWPDGTKRFNKGTWKEGSACRLGKKPKDGDPISMAEGVATALTIRQAVHREFPVFITFDAYNTLHVVKILRAQYPNSPIVIFGDDDFLTVCDRHKAEGITKPVPWSSDRAPWCQCNPGVTRAQKALATITNGSVCVPEFTDTATREAHKWTDFNDLHKAEGIGVVRAQVAGAFAMAKAKAPLRLLPGGKKDPAAKAAGGGKGEGDEPDWDLYDRLLKRYTQIYPSDQAYDHIDHEMVKIEHMRLMWGKKHVNMWLASKKKRVVRLRDVVFDPLGIADKETTLNLFQGIELKPDPERSCDLLIALLYYLCNEDDRVFDWVLKWLAYQIQHIGAKMQTALVMHGDEGTGKNLFFGVVRSIFGMHGGLIGQQQLEAQFNSWLSAKLFLVANEVVTKADMKKHVGFLKTLITEPEIYVERKNIEARSESNHCNFVFLSNELQPLQINPGDRRYMVIGTPPPKDEKYYEAVRAEIRAGGAQALFAYLLDYDLEDFGPHTKPIMTDAKAALVEYGMPSPALFWKELQAGLIPLPYAPAMTDDVYACYVAWCMRRNERPLQSNKFQPEFMKMDKGMRKKVERVDNPDQPKEITLLKDRLRQRTVFIIGQPDPDAQREAHRIRDSVAEFRMALRAWLNEEQMHPLLRQYQRAPF
jgi:putative DNA primase/helicase